MFSSWYSVTISAIIAIFFLWVVSDTNQCQQGLGHNLLQQIAGLNIRRYKGFDSADMVAYMQGVHNDVHVEVYVKNKIMIEANGFEDYWQKFANILKSFTDERKV